MITSLPQSALLKPDTLRALGCDRNKTVEGFAELGRLCAASQTKRLPTFQRD